MLTSMETYERDFTTRDKLDIICDAMRNFKERVFTLELAVWRASCLQFDPRFRSMEDVFEHESSQVFGVFDAHAYKVDCRIKSGADIIVRDVISFVEKKYGNGKLLVMSRLLCKYKQMLAALEKLVW